MGQHILTSPLVEVATYARESFLREAQRHLRCGKCLALPEVIFRVVRVDASKEIVIFRIISFNFQLEVSRVAECSTNHIATILLAFAIEREHHFCMVSMGIAHTIFVLDNLLTRSYRLLYKASLISP